MSAAAPLVDPQAPAAFGFQVRCPEPLRFVRAGGGVETLDVTLAPAGRRPPPIAPVAEWTLAGAGPDVRAVLYQTDQGFEYWVSDVGGYRIDPAARRIEIPPSDDPMLREQRLWSVPTTLCYVRRGDLSLHAAAVEVNGRAVVLAAPGKYGKTTLALAFHRNGHRVLSEDLTCCRPGASPQVLPGPALLRIRPDVYEGQPPSGTHVLMVRPDRVYLGIDQDRKGSSAPVPLKAIVFLRESEDSMKMELAPAPVALADLWALNFRLRTTEARATSFRQLSQIAGAVPAWNLFRPLKLERLDATVSQIVDHLDRSPA